MNRCLPPTASMIIEDSFGSDPLAAAKFYRDRLGWAVHPLHGPNDKNARPRERGKKPIQKNWKSWTVGQVDDGFVKAHFGNGTQANLGVVLHGDHVVVDLDSKGDNGVSVNNWLGEQAELAKVPRERTSGGVHLHFHCSDLPPITKNGKAYEKALLSQIVARLDNPWQNYHDNLGRR